MAKRELMVELVRTNGMIDQDASLRSFVTALQRLSSQEAADNEAIPVALLKVWENNPGLKSVTFDALATFAVQNIAGVTLAGFDDAKERVKEYIRTHESEYYVGKRDGVRLMARCSADELKAIAEARVKAAAKKASETA